VIGEMANGVAIWGVWDMSSDMYQETKKTIFITDSSESFLIYLRNLLERMGFRIIPLKMGYSESTVMVDYQRHGFCEVLPKPITLPALAEKRKSVLEEKNLLTRHRTKTRTSSFAHAD